MNDSESAAESSRRELMGLLSRHQRKIFAYIYTLVPNRADADDLLQEACLTIYEKFDTFEPGTDFVAWANRIAWWKVRQSRQKFARSKVVFDEAVMESVSRTAIALAPELDQRHVALEHCLGKLNDRDRIMILTRYERGHGVAEAASQSGRSLNAAYKALARLRNLLFDCVTNRLERESAVSS
ncbi:MAG: sigma-70 family RNA polymerase sigma factor [Opitutales bacterium]